MSPYRPDKKILERYADVLVNFALGDGKGIKKGDVVYIVTQEYAKPLYMEVLKAITKAGGHAISQYAPDDDAEFSVMRDFYAGAQKHQLDFFPEKYFRGLVDEMHHNLWIISDTDMALLKDVHPSKIMARAQAMKPFRMWRDEKENRGELHWTIALYGTAAMAKEAGLSERAYWNEIINACFLDNAHPVAKWRAVDTKIRTYARLLNKMKIERVHMKGPDVDLWMTLGATRLWEGGGGKNIPSFEIFTSPDWHGTEGWIQFNNPVYAHGSTIAGIFLKFEKGVVVKATAKKNQALLTHMIKVPGANKVGEFSLTDRRFSRITKFMAETLYDENVGGPNGNTHLALGRSFHLCYRGDPTAVKEKDWDKLGFNSSAVHQDIVSTAPRTVTAYMKSGEEKIIYRGGRFIL
jgi:aminopeptidase